jgi:hypothetical protein
MARAPYGPCWSSASSGLISRRELVWSDLVSGRAEPERIEPLRAVAEPERQQSLRGDSRA